MNVKTSPLLKQVLGRFLIHLTLYPVLLIIALCFLSVCVWPEGIHGKLHPFMNAAGELDQEFAPKYISDQFAYYCLIPGWLVLGVLTGVIFRLKRAPVLVRTSCLTLFSLFLFGLCLVDPWLPFVRSWEGWAPATAGLLCATSVCYWQGANRLMIKILTVCSVFAILFCVSISRCASAFAPGTVVSQKLPPNANYNRGEAAVKAKHFTEAASWFQKAAEEGYVRGENRLGRCYAHGEGVPKNDEKALYWYRKAANKGFAPAQFNLGLCYKDAKGVPKSYVTAVAWYRKAAAQGHARAQNNLGASYESGGGVPKSYEKALYWYHKAADQGHPTAEYNLGYCYEQGKGVPKSKEKALFWYRKARDGGYLKADNAVRKLESR